MTRGYPAKPSVSAGSTLTLHISTTAPAFRIGFYRQGAGLTYMGDLECDWIGGIHAPPRGADQDWDWPAYDFAIPADWPAGVYIAILSEGDGSGKRLTNPDVSTPDGSHSKMLFVVRNPARSKTAPILYKLPLFTYQAYNIGDPECGKAGQSLYTGAQAVSLRRPGGGTGGQPWDIAVEDVYDRSSPRQTFAHWDAPFIKWLERNGYVVDYCTDFDIHQGAEALEGYRLLLSVGHDEYWSDAMRENVETFVQRGGNVGFFSGNICWWRIVVDDEKLVFSRVGGWDEHINPKNGRSHEENSLTGVSYRNAGSKWKGPRHATGYKVQHADHWVYKGTGLKDGDVFGARQRLVGYECDGAPFDRRRFIKGQVVYPSGEQNTPRDFVILGIGDISRWDVGPLPSHSRLRRVFLQRILRRTVSGEILGNAAATMGIYQANGTVFTAATIDWPRVLASGKDASVERITRNVLDRLS